MGHTYRERGIVHGVKTPNNFEKSGYLSFERVTMVGFTFCLIAFWDTDGQLREQCPSQMSLIDLSLLTVEAKKWLNEHHAEVEWGRCSTHVRWRGSRDSVGLSEGVGSWIVGHCNARGRLECSLQLYIRRGVIWEMDA